MKLRSGDIFLDEYEVLHAVGAGAFATVYKARQPRLDRDVAIKMLQVNDTVARKRYEVEAKVVARLRHPATVRVYDYGVFEDSPFMVLEFVTGRTLRRVIDWRGPFPVDRIISILHQMLESLAEAHELGVLHRDLKPGNVMLYQPDPNDPVDRIKILDFGLAKLLDDGGNSFMTHPGRLTAQGTTVGTLHYMSPEQMRGRGMGPSSDLFSVGVMAHELLCGSHPYSSLQGFELAARMADAEPIRLPEDTKAPEALKTIVHRLLEKQVHARYESAREVLDELERLRDDLSCPPTMEDIDGEEATTQMPGVLLPASYTQSEGRSYVSILDDAEFQSSPTASVHTSPDSARRSAEPNQGSERRPVVPTETNQVQKSSLQAAISSRTDGKISRNGLVLLSCAVAFIVLMSAVLLLSFMSQ